MSYEYNAHDDFPIPHPDWSGYLAPRADEEFALAPTNLTPQATNYQGHAHGYSDTGEYLLSWRPFIPLTRSFSSDAERHCSKYSLG